MVKLNDTGLFVAKQNGVNYAVSAELLKEYTSPLAKQELGDPYSPGVPGMVMPGDGFTYDETTGLLDVSIPPGIKFVGLIGTDSSNGEVLVPDPDLSEAGSFYIVAEDDEFFGVDEADWPGLVGDAYGNVHLNLNDKVVLTEQLEWVIIPTISSDAYLGRYGDRVSNAPGDVRYQFNQSLTFESVPSDVDIKAGGNINLDSTNLNGNFTDNVIVDIGSNVYVNQNGTELKINSSGLIQTQSQDIALVSTKGTLIGDDWNVNQTPIEDTHIVNKKHVDDELYDAYGNRIYVTHEEFELDQERQDKESLARDAFLEIEILALTKLFNDEQDRQDQEIEALKGCAYDTATGNLVAFSGDYDEPGLQWITGDSNLSVGTDHNSGWPNPANDPKPDTIYINNEAYAVTNSGLYTSAYWYTLEEDISSLVGSEVTVSLCLSPDYITREEFEEDQERQDNRITELEEELDAIAPIVDTGIWIYDGTQSTVDANPTSGKFYLQYKDPNTNTTSVVTSYSQANQIVVHNTDSTGNNNTWADVEVGQYVQLFDKNDNGTIVGSLITPPKDNDLGGYVVMFIDKVNHREPNPENDEEVRLKIFQPPTGGGDASQFILRTGDTMEGDLTFEDPNDATNVVNIVMKNEGELQTTKINSAGMGSLKLYHNNQLKMMFEVNDIKLQKDAVYDNSFSKDTDDDSKYIPDTAWVKKVIDFTQYDELTP